MGDGIFVNAYMNVRETVNKDATTAGIFSLQFELMDYLGAYAPYDETCHLANEIKRTTISIFLGVDHCNRALLTVTEGHKLT